MPRAISIFKAEVKEGLNRTASFPKQILTEEDIIFLPSIVKKYLRYIGAIGKEKVISLRTLSEINMNMGEDRGWTKVIAEEYNFFDTSLTRLVLMKLKMKGLPVTGLDSYIRGNGRMLIRPLDLFTAVDAKGHEMDDSSAAAMLLLNMCTSAPATLIDNRISWEVISPTSVKVMLNDNDLIVSGILDFREDGELISFCTEDKYYAPTGKNYERLKWSTPVKDYQILNSMKLPTYGEATWHFPEGASCYGKLSIKQITYNC